MVACKEGGAGDATGLERWPVTGSVVGHLDALDAAVGQLATESLHDLDG